MTTSDQEQRLSILDSAMWRLAHLREECEYDNLGTDRPRPCDCYRCIALIALETSRNWRFHGARHERTQSEHWPRERKMHAAWMMLANRNQGGPDHLLANILHDGHGDRQVPSARDWYVATSVIQWLATNVGMTVLEAAGFAYQQGDQDRADAETFHRRQQRETEDQVDTIPKESR